MTDDTHFVSMPTETQTYIYDQRGSDGRIQARIVSSMPLVDIARLQLDEQGQIIVRFEGTGGGGGDAGAGVQQW